MRAEWSTHEWQWEQLKIQMSVDHLDLSPCMHAASDHQCLTPDLIIKPSSPQSLNPPVLSAVSLYLHDMHKDVPDCL